MPDARAIDNFDPNLKIVSRTYWDATSSETVQDVYDNAKTSSASNQGWASTQVEDGDRMSRTHAGSIYVKRTWNGEATPADIVNSINSFLNGTVQVDARFDRDTQRQKNRRNLHR